MGTDQSNSWRGVKGRFRFLGFGIIVWLLVSVISLASDLYGSSNRRAALVIESIANKGTDTLLYNSLTRNLGYEVRWITPDTVVLHNSVYFDTAFDVVIWCGNEVAGPSPNTVADTIANSHAGFVSLQSETWDEINLGVNSNGTNGRTAESIGLVRTINRSHWITRVLQDSVYLWAATAVGIYGLAFPDTCHDIQPLIVDKDNAADTAFVHLAVADSGATIINTGDGRNVAKGRRVFLGLFSVTSTPRDSCQYYTIFNRAVAWAAKDTVNPHIVGYACFSGKTEIEDAWAENSSGTDSLESYGGWQSLYTGFDFDPKVAFMQIRNDAVQRKLTSLHAAVETFTIRARVLAVSNDLADSLWESTNGIRLLKQKWICGNATGQSNTHFVSWVHRYIEAVDTMRWYVGGAFGFNSDVVDTVLDSIQQNRGNTASGNYVHWSIPPAFAQFMIADTTNNHGWVWHNFWNNQVGQINDAEIIYHSSEANAIADRPVVTVSLGMSGNLLARRRTSILGYGLLGGIK